MTPEIPQLFWKHLQPGTEDEVLLEPGRVDELYLNGWADVKRVPKESWVQAFAALPRQEGMIRFKKDDLNRVKPLLYKGPLQPPFDPGRLKEGIREIKWLEDFYHKVLRFETDLTLAEWKQIIQEEISPKSYEKGYFDLDSYAKEFLKAILEERASPLRRLEFLVHSPTAQNEASEEPKKTPTVLPPSDQFAASPHEPQKMKGIEKRFYQDERKPQVSDTESLDILEEISQLPDESDPEDPLG